MSKDRHATATPELLGILLEEHGAALRLYARQWCDTPDDIVQESLIKLARQKRLPDRLLPWLYRVVRNGAISASRAMRRRARYESEAGRATDPWFAPHPGSGIDEAAASDALRCLPLDQREAVVAHIWGNLSFAEIGELSGSSSSTAHRRYAEGVRTLRERLGVSC